MIIISYNWFTDYEKLMNLHFICLLCKALVQAVFTYLFVQLIAFVPKQYDLSELLIKKQV